MPQQQKNDWRDSPVALFVLLESARQKGDFERATEAKRRLREMGIEVRYGSRAEAVVRR